MRKNWNAKTDAQHASNISHQWSSKQKEIDAKTAELFKKVNSKEMTYEQAQAELEKLHK